ncbi:1,4-dihydroxy-2-naphthoate octaprenyltransferase [Ichthyenterobacterium sp. W332]|uniref:1,4-dihydroxy-2-naphthoate octaprenyltransferase n=1 Tax=Microcosmobacter mediterraneus TaxID=3075607 RepID=A0ABU2YNF5_9FLAO|nr:1,4-dihydroxy-2-naphthoate octaprenyltransferase [Ichthyenterobacterium sp. W332]MDT0559421.1 1,4-dihydroxy-2-naphthoate octaprenyltransferase [Ichthyenterobacterium sp. W332]
MIQKIKPWLSAMRLRTLPLSVSGIIVGACIAQYNGAFNVWIFILAILTTMSLQILSNLANDYGDGIKGTDNNERIGPERAIQSGEISPELMFEGIKINILIVIFFTFLLIWNAFGSGNLFYALLFLVLGGICVYAAMSYTVGHSPYGYRALGDIYVFVFFGFVSVIGSYFLFTLRLDHVVILPAISIGLLSVGVLNLNNMRDINSDIKSNKITIAVKLGKDKAKKYHTILIITALIVSILFSILYYSSPYNFIFYIAFIPLLRHLVIINKIKDPKEFDGQLKVLAMSTFLFSILLGLGQVFY